LRASSHHAGVSHAKKVFGSAALTTPRDVVDPPKMPEKRQQRPESPLKLQGQRGLILVAAGVKGRLIQWESLDEG